MDFNNPLSFEEFKEASYEAWKAQALLELKKDDIKSLQWKTSQNIPAGPYYDTSVASLTPYHNHINPPDDYFPDARIWENRQFINYADDELTNKKILHALKGGADGIVLNIYNKNLVFEKLLKEVKLSYCSISFITNEPEVISGYLKYCQSTGEYEKISGGVFWSNTKTAISAINALAGREIPKAFRYIGFNPDLPLPQQLKTVAELAELSTEHDFTELLKTRVAITLNVQEDYFQGLALTKAIRITSYQLLKAINRDILPEDIFIQAFSPVYRNEKLGPHENMLKSTTAAMAAIIGGCNGLVLIPENEENPFMQRIARNISHVLKEEAYLGKVADPSAGSYFIDHLVEKTVKHLWQQIRD